MITTTALFTEYFVVGATAWLWLIPIIMLNRGISFPDMLTWVASMNSVFVVTLGLVTYLLGVFTESLSFAVEKMLVGATSAPRIWYRMVFHGLSDDDWFAAQERIWSSETAFREFIYTRLRITISRGVMINAGLGSVAAFMCNRFSPQHDPLITIGYISLALMVVSSISWWFAQIEYIAHVRVAGRMRNSNAVRLITTKSDTVPRPSNAATARYKNKSTGK
jgi:hypothetical protein